MTFRPATASVSRHAWVDYAKGICMIAVVAMYINSDLRRELARGVATGASIDSGWFQWLVAFAKPFRMPDFFLLSGLFLSRVIDRPWRTYVDNRVVHYLYFFLLWTFIFFLTRVAAGIAHASPGELAQEFGAMLVQPFAMMWFLEMLAIYALLTRLTRKVPVWLMFGLQAALQISHYKSEFELVQQFGERFVFFFAGYAFAPAFFKIAEWTDRHRVSALLALAAWAAINAFLVHQGWAGWRGISLVLGFAGATAVIVLSRLLCSLPWMDWLRYLGEHSIVIYLGFYIPMSVATQLLGRKPEWIFDFGSAALAITVGSIFAALLLYWAVRRTPARILFDRPEWARLTPRKVVVPAEAAQVPVG